MAKKATTRGNSESQPDSAGAPAKPRARRAPKREPAASAPDSGMGNAIVAASAESNASVTPSLAPNDDDIRVRAYHRYLERGGSDGMDFEDWLEAERELKQGK